MSYTFYKWDYDNGVVQTLQREGDCNGCGKCCQSLIHLRTQHYHTEDPRDGFSTVEHSGVWSETVNSAGDRRFIAITSIGTVLQEKHCPLQNDDNTCSVQLTKALVCSAWPMLPEQVAPFEGCPYTFTVIGEQQISDVVNPPPLHTVNYKRLGSVKALSINKD